jgi:hypothetical protein
MRVLADIPFMTFEPGAPAISQSVRVGLSLASIAGHCVNSYVELLEKIAALNYHNSRYRLLFRGQSRDYRFNIHGEEGGRSNLYPSILRATPGTRRDVLLDRRFARLKRAEQLLISNLKVADVRSLRVVRWAILQHYGVCETPLLDVTLSLQSALSFASEDGESSDGFLYVLAIPHISGPVSISTESMTQVIDLSQICPPGALRPHFQSGILMGDYPEYVDRRDTHNGLGFVENDFSCRLLTKFHLRDLRRWKDEGFTPTPHELLFPDDRDQWFGILQAIKKEIEESPLQSGLIE